MTQQDFENKTFNELISQLNEEMDDIHSRESMLDMAKHEIDCDNLFVAIHILEDLWNSDSDWYQYDRNMGTLESVTPLRDKEDIEDFIWEE